MVLVADHARPAVAPFHEKTYGKDFSYPQFLPQWRAELFDPDQWAKIFADGGVKYVVLVSKHHDGFCFWPSAEANRTWGRPWNSVDAGPRRDLAGDLTKAVRKRGLTMGLYYSLYEWYNPLWLKDKQRYVAEHMFPQMKDLVNRYAPSVLYTDGEWDLPSSEWRSPEMLAWLLNEAPGHDTLVVNDRWGKECRHKHGGYWTTEYTAGLPSGDHPWEEGRAMAASFGYSRTEPLEDYRSGQELVWMLADLVSRGGNLLLGIGTTADGRIPVIMQDRLAEMGQWLKVNGEAIYGTRVWTTTCQWTDGEQPKLGFGQFRLTYDVAKLVGMHSVEGQARKQAFFTTRPGKLYAILPRWPGKTFTLKGVKLDAAATVQMLGREETLAHQVADGDTVIQIPQLNVEQLPCKHAWTLKISGIGPTAGR